MLTNNICMGAVVPTGGATGALCPRPPSCGGPPSCKGGTKA